MDEKKSKFSGNPLSDEEQAEYEKTWKDMEDCFNELEVICDEDEEEDE